MYCFRLARRSTQLVHFYRWSDLLLLVVYISIQLRCLSSQPRPVIIGKMLRLLPLLALTGVLASPLDRRQDVSASVSSVSAAITSGEASLSGSTSTAVVSAVSSAAASPTASAAGNGTTTAAAPSVTMYPDTSAGEPIVVTGQKSPLIPGVDTYLGVPFAAPRMSHPF
jgi:hypothetical protein